MSSASPGWSLLPSSILIVVALVNSDIPHQGTWVSQRDLGVLPHSLTVPLPQDCCAFRLVPVSIVVEATSKWTVWLPPCVFCIRCVTILGVPGWAPTEDTQPKPRAKACLGCDLSHQVWIVRTSGKGNTLSYPPNKSRGGLNSLVYISHLCLWCHRVNEYSRWGPGFYPWFPIYVHMQAGMARVTIHLGRKDGLG